MESNLRSDDLAIAAFWRWFSSAAAVLADDFENPRLLAELDARISTFGKLAWELGPGARAENALAISPDGDPSLLPLTERIVAGAPNVDGWEFLPARPPRPEFLQFSVAGPNGREIEFDASSWRYVLYEHRDGTFDIVVEQDNSTHSIADEQYTAAVVLLDAILGERARLNLISEVEPVSKLTPEQESKANRIQVLAEHLDSIAGSGRS